VIEEINATLGELDKSEDEKENLKVKLKEANECIRKLREQTKKIKERQREVSVQLKKANVDITKLKVQVEEQKIIMNAKKKKIKIKLMNAQSLNKKW
jgi:phage shock protein A